MDEFMPDTPPKVIPPTSRVTYKIGKRGLWQSAEITTDGTVVSVRTDNGQIYTISLADVRKVSFGSFFIGITLERPLSGTTSKVFNLAFGDGNAFFKNATKGTLYGTLQNRKLESATVNSPELLAWRGFFRSIQPRGLNAPSIKRINNVGLAGALAVIVVIVIILIVVHL